jgi:general secretion pathway protein G
MRLQLHRIPMAARLAIATLAVALIVSFAVRGIVQATQEAKVKRAEAEIAILKHALDRYYVDNGAYPQSLGILCDPQDPPADKNDLANLNARRYLAGLPEVDPWGNQFSYETDGKMYVLKSFGADGAPGGQGDDADIVADADEHARN